MPWLCVIRRFDSLCPILAQDISAKPLCFAIYARTYTWILPAVIVGCDMKRHTWICERSIGAHWMSRDHAGCCSALILHSFRAVGTPQSSKRKPRRFTRLVLLARR